MHPETDKLFLAGYGVRFDQQTAQHHTSKVSQVEDIVGLGRSGEQVGHSLLVHLHGGRHNHGTRGVVLGVEILTLH